MKKHNDVVEGLKGKVVKKSDGSKKVVVKFDPLNKLGYDGCGTHTHKWFYTDFLQTMCHS